MTVHIVSTTDSPEIVKAAIGNTIPGEKKPEPTPAPDPKTDPGQKSASETETEDTDLDGETEESEETDAEKAAAAKDDATKEKPKNKGGFQRRIDKLSAKKAEAERERDYWRNLATQPKAENAGGDKPKSSQAAAETGKPQAANFDTHAEYIEALTDWKVTEKLNASKAEQEKSKVLTERQQVVKAYEDREKSFAKDHADYNEVLEEVADIKASPTMIEAIVTSDNGPALAYELAKNREEFERISNLSPGAAAREMGKIEARLSPQGSGKKPEPKQTKTPKPLEPVGSKGASVDKDIYDPNLTQKEYEAIRAKQRAQARA